MPPEFSVIVPARDHPARAAGSAIRARLPGYVENYIYVLAGIIPGRLRRRCFADAARPAAAGFED